MTENQETNNGAPRYIETEEFGTVAVDADGRPTADFRAEAEAQGIVLPERVIQAPKAARRRFTDEQREQRLNAGLVALAKKREAKAKAALVDAVAALNNLHALATVAKDPLTVSRAEAALRALEA